MNLKTFSPRLLAAMLLLSFFIFQSCDDEEPKDTVAPEVSITSVTENMSVSNTVTLEVNASDNASLSQLEFFVDDNLIASDTEDPFEFSWDSNTVTDGSHTVKVIATDKSGNASEKAVTINVINTLLTFTIGANQLDLDPNWAERGFVFLSDADGKLIASTEYLNGNTVTMKSSTFNGEKFFVTDVLVQKNEDGENFVRAWTFSGIERGKKWTVLDDLDDEDETYVGNANLTYTNPASNYFYDGYARNENVSYSEFGGTNSIRLKKSPSLVYLVRYPTDDQSLLAPTFNLYSGIVVGNNTLNLALANKALTKAPITLPADVLYASVEMEGFEVANNYTDPYRVGYFSSSSPKLDVYYPGNSFPSYYTEIYYETGKMGYSRGTPSTSLALPTISNNVAFTFSNNKLSYTATGNQDFTTTMFFNKAETAYWSLVLPNASASTVLPALELPAALKTFDLPLFTLPESFGVSDFEEITGYDGLINFMRNSPDGAEGLYTKGKTWTDIDYYSASTNGRAKNVRTKYKAFGKSLRK